MESEPASLHGEHKSVRLSAQVSTDGFEPAWHCFEEFFYARSDGATDYLIARDEGENQRACWSVDAWMTAITELGEMLRGWGVERGSVVAVLGGNSAPALAVTYACWTIGATVLPLNAGESEERLEYILRDSGASPLLYTEKYAALGVALEARCRVTAIDSKRFWDQGLGEAFPARRHNCVGLEESALLVYTSGTTADPKPVRLTMRNILVHTHALAQALEWRDFDRVITVLPIHHVNGLLIGCLLPWALSASAVLCDRFRSSSFWQIVGEERATVTSLVPSLLEFLLAGEHTSSGSLREALCGAGPLRGEAAVTFEQVFGVPVRHLYGLSETTAVVSLMPTLSPAERAQLYTDFGFPSIGLPIPHVELEVIDSKYTPVAADIRGQLAVRGGTVFGGYDAKPPIADQPFGGGWFLSGDQGFWTEVDGERYFFITGRTKELIVRGGVNIAPAQIDAVLMSHPAVSFAVAFAFENRFYGEEVAAYVVCESPVDAADIIEHCATHLSYDMSPKVVLFGDDVPFTSTGKARRLELSRSLAPKLVEFRDVQFRKHHGQ